MSDPFISRPSETNTSLTRVPTVVLPGMDGTGDLLEGFRAVAPPAFRVRVGNLPNRARHDYGKLADLLAPSIMRESGCLLVAESFSGPLAIELAARHPDQIVALVLVASLATAPLPRIASWVPWKCLLRRPPPRWVIRHMLLGRDADLETIEEVRAVIQQVPSAILAHRILQLLHLDALDLLAHVQCPILYLRPTQDRLIPRRCLNQLRRIQPEMQVTNLNGPHFILQRHPNAAWQVIADFVRAIQGDHNDASDRSEEPFDES